MPIRIQGILLLTLIGFFSLSCSEDDLTVPSSGDQAINEWIMSNMRRVYLWTDSIPSETDFELSPRTFFRELLVDQDRFSRFYNSADALNNFLDGVSTEAGYEYTLRRIAEGSRELYAVVLYTKRKSPADQAGVRRGDLLRVINGESLTEDNFSSLISQLSAPHTVQFERYNDSLSAYETMPAVSVTPELHKENPNFLDTIYTIDNSTKVGYFVYNFFDDGDVGQEYNEEMDAIIGNFKTQGVNELVIDLRYNGGGFITSATNMASLLARGTNENSVFYELEYNDSYALEILEQRGANSLTRTFVPKEENIGSNLTSGNIYFLVSSGSASASELVINGLAPYMNVVLIGKQTVGKNVGSAIITDDDNPNNPYGLLPTVLRLTNAAGFSEYDEGFSPDYEVEDFEMPLRVFGDLREPMLAQAIALIKGEVPAPQSTRIGADLEEVYNSLEDKPMVLD